VSEAGILSARKVPSKELHGKFVEELAQPGFKEWQADKTAIDEMHGMRQ